MQIYFKNTGLAETVGKDIYINRKLKKYNYAFRKTLQHEIEHTKSKGIFDFWVEIKQFLDIKLTWQLMAFTITHPSSWTQFVPVSRKGINWFLCFIYLIMLGVLIW